MFMKYRKSTLIIVFSSFLLVGFAQHKPCLYTLLHDFKRMPAEDPWNKFINDYNRLKTYSWYNTETSNASYEISDGCLEIFSKDHEPSNSSWYHFFIDYNFSSDSIWITGEWKCENGKAIVTLQQGDSIFANSKICDSESWTKFHLKIPYDHSGTYPLIAFDFNLASGGEAKVRDLRMSNDGMDVPSDIVNSETLPVKQLHLNRPFSSKYIQRLNRLCLVWGIMKYYHPDSRELAIDWNKELFAMLAYVNEPDFEKKLDKYICGYHIFPTGREKSQDEIISRLKLPWLKKNTLGKKIYNYLHKILDTDLSNYESQNVTHLATQAEEKVTFFINEPIYEKANIEDVGHRLFSLFRFWNMIYYFHPYMQTKEDYWLKLLPKYIRLFAGSCNRFEYEDAVYQICSELKDSHTRVYGLEYNIEACRMWDGFFFPMSVDRFGRSVFVTDISKEESELTGFNKGDEILAVNGVKIKYRIASKAKYNTYPAQADPYGGCYITFNDTTVEYRIRRNEKICKLKIGPDVISKVWQLPRKSQVSRHSGALSNNIYYMNVGTATDKTLEQQLKDAIKYESVIFDLRIYPQAERKLAERLLADYILGKTPENFYTSYVDLYQPGIMRKNSIPVFDKTISGQVAFAGKIAILNNRNTISQGELLTSLLREHPRSVVVGQPSAGVMTPVVYYPFICGVGTRFTTGELYNESKGIRKSANTHVDIPVHPSEQTTCFEGDAILYKAFEYLINNK